jgi:hypothetical protein
MIRKRLLGVAAAAATVAGGLAVLTATAPGAQAICTAFDCPDGPPPTTRPAPPTTTRPPASLRPSYIGTLSGDLGSSAQTVLRFSGTTGAVTARVDLAEGLHTDCHGDQNLGMLDVTLSGNRFDVWPDGNSRYSLSRNLTTTVSGNSVDLSISALAWLSPDGRTVSGSVSVHADVQWPYDNCDKSWSFSTRAV